MVFELFAVQYRGTKDVGRVFGPVMVLWFLVIGALGLIEIARQDPNGHERTLAAMQANVRVCKGIYIEPPEIAYRDRERVREAASIVASHPAVRQSLLAYQRAFARRKPGAVLDGRDIGTVICPEADVKLFVTASPEERARRRYLELREAGNSLSEAEVLADIRRRDERDKSRDAAPLRQAEDAYLLDTTNLDIDAAFKAAIALIDAAMGRAGQAG